MHQLSNDNLVAGGKLGNKTVDGVDHENVMFSPDDSARVIHFGSFGFKVLNIEKDYETEAYYLEETFSLKSDRDKESDSTAPPPPTSRVGRQVVRPANYYDNVAETVSSVTFRYEDELGLLTTMTVRLTLRK